MSWYTLYTPKNHTDSIDSNSNKTASKKTSGHKSYASIKLAKSNAELEQLKNNIAKEKAELNKTLQAQQEENTARNSYEDLFAEDPITAALNLAFIRTTANYKLGHRYNNVKGSFDAANVNFYKNDKSIDFNTFAKNGIKYSANTGHNLAKTVANSSVGFTGQCSKYVRQGLERSKISNGHTSAAADMGSVLSKNKHFQEVSPSSVNLRALPAGCVLVYARGAAGYNAKYGHIEVTLGDSRACSDGVTNNIRSTQGMRVFIPVENA